jgi:hypothetical protein
VKTTPASPTEKIEGVVTARPCDCCGHHEIGIVTVAGDYIPLRPGMRASILDPTGRHADDATGITDVDQ